MSDALRKPQSRSHARDATWAAIRELGTFTLADIRQKTGLLEPAGYLLSLRAAKIVRVVSKSNADGWAVYTLIDDRGVIAPRLDGAGRELPPSEQERAWYAIKALGTFTVPALTATAEGRPGSVRAYVSALVKAGYLDVTRAGRGQAIYTLRSRMWTGRRAPEIHRAGVYDPNLNRMMTGAA